MFSKSEENYLKAIYTLSSEKKDKVNTNIIAEKMKTKASSVTDMIRKLSEKDLLVYEKYKGVKLSEKGKKAAINIVRKHRIWETFLVKKLNFGWDEVHEIAEQLEHVQSDKLINRLEEFLCFPERDPHGELIPDKSGNIQPTLKTLLSELQPGEKGILISVKNSSKEFLQYLDTLKIIIGAKLTVVSKNAFDHSMCIKLEHREIHISQSVSNNLYIETLV